MSRSPVAPDAAPSINERIEAWLQAEKLRAMKAFGLDPLQADIRIVPSLIGSARDLRDLAGICKAHVEANWLSSWPDRAQVWRAQLNKQEQEFANADAETRLILKAQHTNERAYLRLLLRAYEPAVPALPLEMQKFPLSQEIKAEVTAALQAKPIPVGGADIQNIHPSVAKFLARSILDPKPWALRRLIREIGSSQGKFSLVAAAQVAAQHPAATLPPADVLKVQVQKAGFGKLLPVQKISKPGSGWSR